MVARVEQWKRFYRPFKLGKRLVIRPPWEPYTAAADELLLTLNPDRPSEPVSMRRRNCASPPWRRSSACDLVCTFSTSVVAAGSSAWPACYSDVPGRSASMSIAWPSGWRVNARLNQLSKQARFAAGSLEVVTDRFDIVVANILLEPILTMLKPLHTAIVPGGTVVLSGILTEEVPQLRGGLLAQRMAHHPPGIPGRMDCSHL